jgi:hypothetical protein
MDRVLPLTGKESVMPEPCEFLERCGFFINYKANTEVVRNGWVALFCEDQEKSERCARKKVRRETGQPPADNMSPTGDMLLV